MKITKEQFINYMIDCKGLGENEAKEVAEEYRNDLEVYLRDCGANDENIDEVKECINYNS